MAQVLPTRRSRPTIIGQLPNVDYLIFDYRVDMEIGSHRRDMLPGKTSEVVGSVDTSHDGLGHIPRWVSRTDTHRDL